MKNDLGVAKMQKVEQYQQYLLQWDTFQIKSFFGVCKNLRLFKADYMASIKLRNWIHTKSSAI